MLCLNEDCIVHGMTYEEEIQADSKTLFLSLDVFLISKTEDAALSLHPEFQYLYEMILMTTVFVFRYCQKQIEDAADSLSIPICS